MERKKAPETWTRLTSMHCAFPLHWLISPCQKAKPDWSGKRERKSTYCCWTKKSVSSMVMGVLVPGRSLSGLTFVLPYISSEGSLLPSSETMRSVDAWWLWASAAEAVKATARTAAINLRICLLQIRESYGESVTLGLAGRGVLGNSRRERGCSRHDRVKFRQTPGLCQLQQIDDLMAAGTPCGRCF